MYAHHRVKAAYEQVSLPLELPRNSRFKVERGERSYSRGLTTRTAYHGVDNVFAMDYSENNIRVQSGHRYQAACRQSTHYSYQDILANTSRVEPVATEGEKEGDNEALRESHRAIDAGSSKRILLGPNTPITTFSTPGATTPSATTSSATSAAIASTCDSFVGEKAIGAKGSEQEAHYQQHDLFEDLHHITAFDQSTASRYAKRYARDDTHRVVALRRISNILNSERDDESNASDAKGDRQQAIQSMDEEKKKPQKSRSTPVPIAISKISGKLHDRQDDTRTDTVTDNVANHGTDSETDDLVDDTTPAAENIASNAADSIAANITDDLVEKTSKVFADASRLKTLLDSSTSLWRGDSLQSKAPACSSGYPELDAILPTRGWPTKSIVEVLTPAWGIGELKLLLPRMRELTQQKQWVIWISPPYQPYAPALLQAGVDINYVIIIDPKTSCKDAIWSMEKALQTSACAMVLAWTNWLPNGVVRRLQLAAEKGGGMAFLFREREIKNSPVALRLQLHPHQQGIAVQVLKARGSYHYKNVVVPLAG